MVDLCAGLHALESTLQSLNDTGKLWVALPLDLCETLSISDFYTNPSLQERHLWDR